MATRFVRFASTCLLAVALCSVAGSALGADRSYQLTVGQSVQIGTLDSMGDEFNTTGLRGLDEFVWVVGIDKNLQSLPATLASPSTFAEWDPQGGAVERLTIVFATDATVHNVLVDVTKGGAETLLIEYDGSTHEYLAKDIGSSEGLVPGVAELEMTNLRMGWHVFTMSLADDGLGNGHSYIDAIAIKATD